MYLQQLTKLFLKKLNSDIVCLFCNVKKIIVITLFALFHVAFNEPEKKNIPIGMIRVSFYTYLNETEVSMKEWKDFMIFRQENYNESILKYRPDFERISLDWKVNINLNEAFDSGQLDGLPVVGIKYEDAVRYIQYKNELDHLTEKKRSEFKKLEYFLPNSELDTLLGAPNAIISGTRWSKILTNNIPVCAVRKNEGKSKIGLYFYHDNVSEMSARKGYALRGNYRTGKINAGLGCEQEFLVPSGWIGFRIAARVIQE